MKDKILFFIAILLIFHPVLAQKSSAEVMPGFVKIPAGKYNGKEMPKFSMAATEVTNRQYRDFLNDLRVSGDTVRLKAAMVDTAQWNTPVSNQEFADAYFQTSSYDAYPVVNVSKQGAYLYCEWLAQTFKKSGKQVQVSLPTEAQWEYAAKGGDSSAIYPWQGKTTKYEKKGTFFGTYLSNYNRGWDKDHPVYDSTKVYSKVDITAPAQSYMPNKYKLYNMSGNVAEMVSDQPITKGGSYLSPAAKVTISAHEDFIGTKGACMVGFRPIIW